MIAARVGRQGAALSRLRRGEQMLLASTQNVRVDDRVRAATGGYEDECATDRTRGHRADMIAIERAAVVFDLVVCQTVNAMAMLAIEGKEIQLATSGLTAMLRAGHGQQTHRKQKNEDDRIS
jgi:hypothetical protein